MLILAQCSGADHCTCAHSSGSAVEQSKRQRHTPSPSPGRSSKPRDLHERTIRCTPPCNRSATGKTIIRVHHPPGSTFSWIELTAGVHIRLGRSSPVPATHGKTARVQSRAPNFLAHLDRARETYRNGWPALNPIPKAALFSARRNPVWPHLIPYTGASSCYRWLRKKLCSTCETPSTTVTIRAIAYPAVQLHETNLRSAVGTVQVGRRARIPRRCRSTPPSRWARLPSPIPNPIRFPQIAPGTCKDPNGLPRIQMTMHSEQICDIPSGTHCRGEAGGGRSAESGVMHVPGKEAENLDVIEIRTEALKIYAPSTPTMPKARANM